MIDYAQGRARGRSKEKGISSLKTNKQTKKQKQVGTVTDLSASQF